MCFSALSALVLVLAVETNRARWWIAYGLAVAAVLYTHYTGVFVIGVQGAWALLLHRGRWRGLVLAYLGAALLYLPWLPHVHGDPSNLKLWGSLTGRSHWRCSFLQWAAGSPEVASSALPGVLALVLIAAGVVVGLVARAIGPWRDSPGLLIPLLALASPVGILLAGHNLFLLPRNLKRVPPVRGVARRVDRDPARQGRRRPGRGAGCRRDGNRSGEDAPASVPPARHALGRPFCRRSRSTWRRRPPCGRGRRGLHPQSADGHRIRRRPRVGVAPDASAKNFKGAGPGQRVFVLQLQTSDLVVPPSVPRWQQVSHERYDGFVPVSVAVYRRRPLCENGPCSRPRPSTPRSRSSCSDRD